jgi:hypothetical protein
MPTTFSQTKGTAPVVRGRCLAGPSRRPPKDGYRTGPTTKAVLENPSVNAPTKPHKGSDRDPPRHPTYRATGRERAPVPCWRTSLAFSACVSSIIEQEPNVTSLISCSVSLLASRLR